MMSGWLADLHDKATEILSTDWRVSNDGIYVPPERVRALCELAEAAEHYEHVVEEVGREDGGIALQVAYRGLRAALAGLGGPGGGGLPLARRIATEGLRRIRKGPEPTWPDTGKRGS